MTDEVVETDASEDPFSQAVGIASACLQDVSYRLKMARAAREELRLEIKQLVWEERQLTRMVRIGGELPRDEEEPSDDE